MKQGVWFKRRLQDESVISPRKDNQNMLDDCLRAEITNRRSTSSDGMLNKRSSYHPIPIVQEVPAAPPVQLFPGKVDTTLDIASLGSSGKISTDNDIKSDGSVSSSSSSVINNDDLVESVLSDRTHEARTGIDESVVNGDNRNAIGDILRNKLSLERPDVAYTTNSIASRIQDEFVKIEVAEGRQRWKGDTRCRSKLASTEIDCRNTILRYYLEREKTISALAEVRRKMAIVEQRHAVEFPDHGGFTLCSVSVTPLRAPCVTGISPGLKKAPLISRSPPIRPSLLSEASLVGDSGSSCNDSLGAGRSVLSIDVCDAQKEVVSATSSFREGLDVSSDTPVQAAVLASHKQHRTCPRKQSNVACFSYKHVRSPSVLCLPPETSSPEISVCNKSPSAADSGVQSTEFIPGEAMSLGSEVTATDIPAACGQQIQLDIPYSSESSTLAKKKSANENALQPSQSTASSPKLPAESRYPRPQSSGVQQAMVDGLRSDTGRLPFDSKDLLVRDPQNQRHRSPSPRQKFGSGTTPKTPVGARRRKQAEMAKIESVARQRSTTQKSPIFTMSRHIEPALPKLTDITKQISCHESECSESKNLRQSDKIIDRDDSRISGKVNNFSLANEPNEQTPPSNSKNAKSSRPIPFSTAPQQTPNFASDIHQAKSFLPPNDSTRQNTVPALMNDLASNKPMSWSDIVKSKVPELKDVSQPIVSRQVERTVTNARSSHSDGRSNKSHGQKQATVARQPHEVDIMQLNPSRMLEDFFPAHPEQLGKPRRKRSKSTALPPKQSTRASAHPPWSSSDDRGDVSTINPGALEFFEILESKHIAGGGTHARTKFTSSDFPNLPEAARLSDLVNSLNRKNTPRPGYNDKERTTVSRSIGKPGRPSATPTLSSPRTRSLSRALSLPRCTIDTNRNSKMTGAFEIPSHVTENLSRLDYLGIPAKLDSSEDENHRTPENNETEEIEHIPKVDEPTVTVPKSEIKLSKKEKAGIRRRKEREARAKRKVVDSERMRQIERQSEVKPQPKGTAKVKQLVNQLLADDSEQVDNRIERFPEDSRRMNAHEVEEGSVLLMVGRSMSELLTQIKTRNAKLTSPLVSDLERLDATFVLTKQDSEATASRGKPKGSLGDQDDPLIWRVVVAKEGPQDDDMVEIGALRWIDIRYN